MQLALRRALKKLRVHSAISSGSDACLFQDLANALEGDSQWFKVLRLANRPEREESFLGIHEIIRPDPKDGGDFVVGKLFLFPEHEARAVQEEIHNFRFLVRRDSALRLVHQ